MLINRYMHPYVPRNYRVRRYGPYEDQRRAPPEVWSRIDRFRQRNFQIGVNRLEEEFMNDSENQRYSYRSRERFNVHRNRGQFNRENRPFLRHLNHHVD
jgi:hypothetical protein